MKEVWFLRNKATRGFNSKREEFRFRLWKYVGNILFGCILDPFNFMRIWLLRVFGAKIGKNCYVSRKVGIVLPWLLEVGNDSGIDEYAYINGKVTIGDNVSIASFVKVVSAGHDIRSRYFDWNVSHRIIEDGVFIGANAFVLGGGRSAALLWLERIALFARTFLKIVLPSAHPYVYIQNGFGLTSMSSIVIMHDRYFISLYL